MERSTPPYQIRLGRRKTTSVGARPQGRTLPANASNTTRNNQYGPLRRDPLEALNYRTDWRSGVDAFSRRAKGLTAAASRDVLLVAISDSRFPPMYLPLKAHGSKKF